MAQSHCTSVLTGIAVLAVASNLGFSPVAPNARVTAIAHGQSNQRPSSYADIADEVKPAVVSLRVKADAGEPILDDGLPCFGDLPGSGFCRAAARTIRTAHRTRLAGN